MSECELCIVNVDNSDTYEINNKMFFKYVN